MKKRLKINGVIMFAAFVLIVAFPAIFFRRDKDGFIALDQVAEIFGIALVLLGQILRVSARGFKSEHSHNGFMLIQDGPYALVRNPMYLGILLIGFGIVLMLFKWWVMLIFLFVFTVRYLLLIAAEEKKLKILFPQDYPAYQRKAPRLLPSLAMIFRKGIGEYLPLKLSWLKGEIGSILAILSLALLAESWEDIRKRGAAAYFKELAAYAVIIILFICLVAYLSRRTNGNKKDAAGKS